jgi:hypothetical protein
MPPLDESDLPEAASDGGNYDLREWSLGYDPGTPGFVINMESAATAANGLVRPTLHAIGCSTLKGDTASWPTVDRALLFRLWASERATQPFRRIWFCENCLQRRA